MDGRAALAASTRVYVERLKTGVPGFDPLVNGGIPRGFFVAVVGEPGTGKTVFSIHFAWQGVVEGDKVVYVTTEESRESIVRQAAMFGMDLARAMDKGRLVIIDALMKSKGDEWSLGELDIEELVEKVLEAKKKLGYGRARLVIDSMSAFWLDKPAMARKYSYAVKRILYKWDFTGYLVSQYAITTSEAFGWGVEHVADGIVRFRRYIRGGVLRRYVLVEKMRQTPHSLVMHEINIVDGKGMMVTRPVTARREDVALPGSVRDRIIRARLEEELASPDNVSEGGDVGDDFEPTQ
ncbi:MAG: KaiC domain-containing protein [Desulfurococcales archaeon]|nr:KaiC domain-containing protein [Desulfurococcales archaeon]